METKVIALQTKFTQDYCHWTVLRREGNLILAELKPINGRNRYDVTWVRRQLDHDTIIEKVGSSVNWDGTDPKSDCYFLDKMQGHFDRILAETEKSSERQKTKDEEHKEFLNHNNLWQSKVATARAAQNSLITQLKQMNRATDDLMFFQDKKVVGILDQLARIEQFLHHGRSI